MQTQSGITKDRVITTLIVKLASRCNLSCPYCFMFEHADKSFHQRPKIMPRPVVNALAKRLETYIIDQNIKELLLVFHGGEPLLIGHNGFEYLCEALLSSSVGSALELAVQTNGTLLDDGFIDIFRRYNVTVGISLDGPQASNDKNRPFRNLRVKERSSYEATTRGLKLVQNGLPAHLFRGLLAVCDLSVDPISLFNHFLSLDVRRMDFLFPLRNHKYPHGFDSHANETLFADWYLKIFDEWSMRNDPHIQIRIFDSIMDVLLGSNVSRADIHHSALDVITVETDGAIEPVDDLRISGEHFNRTDLNVITNELEEIFSTNLFTTLRKAEQIPPNICARCDYFNVCGGGGLAYRRTQDDTFDAPSIYCRDIYKIIDRIRQRIGLQSPENGHNNLSTTLLVE